MKTGYAVSATLIAALASPALATPVIAPQYSNPTHIQPVLGQEITSQVTRLLKKTEADCSNLPVEYRVDCLRQGLRAARAEIQRRPDYAAASKELNNAARALDKLVKANIDRNAPKVRVAGKTVRAVKKAAVPKVNAAARQVIAESATRLLRSKGTAEQKAQVAQIARAVDSTKVILRSA